MSRIEHFEEADSPRANSLVPAASAVVQDTEGRVLLHRRSDNGLWTIPGGAMEPGEDIAGCCLREVHEETGLEVEITRLVGLYTNPRHVVEYADGEVRQQFSVCFSCRPVGGSLAVSDESTDVGFYLTDQVEQMDIHPSIRLRIGHALERRSEPFIG